MADDFRKEFIEANQQLVKEVKEFTERYSSVVSEYNQNIEELRSYKKQWWVLYAPILKTAAVIVLFIFIIALLQKINVCVEEVKLPFNLGEFSMYCST